MTTPQRATPRKSPVLGNAKGKAALRYGLRNDLSRSNFCNENENALIVPESELRGMDPQIDIKRGSTE